MDNYGSRQDVAPDVGQSLMGMGRYLLCSGRSQGHPCKGVSSSARGERDAREGVAARTARCSGRSLGHGCGRSGLPGSPRSEDLTLFELRVISAGKAVSMLLHRHPSGSH